MMAWQHYSIHTYIIDLYSHIMLYMHQTRIA